VKQDDKKVNVAGWAASNERVSEFLRNLQSNSKFLDRPELIEIRVSGQQPPGVQRRLFDFALNFGLKPTPERVQMQQPQGQQAAAAPAKKQ
jgi:type IV pilus assembly protein PilN